MKRFLFILFIAVAFMLTQTTLNTDYSAFAKADKETKEKGSKKETRNKKRRKGRKKRGGEREEKEKR